MIRCLLVIALALPIATHAQSSADQNRLHECGMQGLVFQMAATFRDSNWSPQYAFDYLHRAKYDGIDDAFVKKAVNLVYFDDRFVNARGPVLSQQITQACFHPSQWKPVQ